MSNGSFVDPSTSTSTSTLSNPPSGSLMIWLGVFGMCGLIIPEIIGLAGVLVWSLAGLFHLSANVVWLLSAILAIPVLMASAWVAMAAYRAEIAQG